MQLVFQNILRFILVVLVQVFVLDNIQFLGYVSPMLYILFILSLPVRFPRGGVLLLAFFIGLIIDMFNNTMGIPYLPHFSAVRPSIFPFPPKKWEILHHHSAHSE